MKVGIFGSSGMARDAADICYANNIHDIVFIDIKIQDEGDYGVQIITEEEVRKLEDYCFVIALGDGRIRKKVYEKFPDLKYTNLIHPTVTFGKNQFEAFKATQGNIISAGVRFSNQIYPGDFGIYNFNSTIGHDCEIEDFVTISPGANISGNVILGEGANVGAGAVIIQGEADRKLRIGKYATIGAGVVVRNEVPDSTVAIDIASKVKHIPIHS